MKNHLKRIASPRGWNINRKENTFVVRPHAGSHSLEQGLPLGLVIRDMLKMAKTMSEAKKILHSEEILVDGIRRKDYRFMVGLFDSLAIPSLKKYYRIVLDKKGRISIITITAQDSTQKPCKIVGKTVLPGGKTQFNLFDGKNLIGTHTALVGDTFLLSLPKLEVKRVLSLKKGATVFLSKGKQSGAVGHLKEVKGKEASYLVDGKEVETSKNYLFVVGEGESLIQLK
jgi:small subunit ribosomal protein S4e